MERELQERQTLEQKYEKLKKQIKEQETSFNKQISQLEKERAVAVEKFSSADQKRAEIQQRFQVDVSQLTKELERTKEQLSATTKHFSGELERWKQANLQIEQDKNDILTNYDRDKALWDGKFQFLEQQKE